MQWVAQHRKLIVAVLGAAVTVAVQVWGTSNPYVSLAVLAATTFGIYQAPNADPVAAPAAPALPGSRRGRGLPVTGPVKIVPEPQPVQERVAQPPPPGPGVPPEGA